MTGAGAIRKTAGAYSVRTIRVELREADGMAELLAGSLANDPRAVFPLVREWIAAAGFAGQEISGALFLTARNRLIAARTCFVGTLDRAVVEPRVIYRDALLVGAAAVILFHNHPSGDPTPSREDREFTRRMVSAGEAIGVRLLDHVVVGEGIGGTCVSFREAGLL